MLSQCTLMYSYIITISLMSMYYGKSAATQYPIALKTDASPHFVNGTHNISCSFDRGNKNEAVNISLTFQIVESGERCTFTTTTYSVTYNNSHGAVKNVTELQNIKNKDLHLEFQVLRQKSKNSMEVSYTPKSIKNIKIICKAIVKNSPVYRNATVIVVHLRPQVKDLRIFNESVDVTDRPFHVNQELDIFCAIGTDKKTKLEDVSLTLGGKFIGTLKWGRPFKIGTMLTERYISRENYRFKADDNDTLLICGIKGAKNKTIKIGLLPALTTWPPSPVTNAVTSTTASSTTSIKEKPRIAQSKTTPKNQGSSDKNEEKKNDTIKGSTSLCNDDGKNCITEKVPFEFIEKKKRAEKSKDGSVETIIGCVAGIFFSAVAIAMITLLVKRGVKRSENDEETEAIYQTSVGRRSRMFSELERMPKKLSAFLQKFSPMKPKQDDKYDVRLFSDFEEKASEALSEIDAENGQFERS